MVFTPFGIWMSVKDEQHEKVPLVITDRLSLITTDSSEVHRTNISSPQVVTLLGMTID
jgi:hypothetical protein